MTVVFVFLGITVAAALVVLALGLFETAPTPIPDRPVAELADKPLERSEIDSVRFGLGLRGYRMDEVDGLLDRVAGELAARSDRVALLETTLAEHGLSVPGDDQPAPVPAPEMGPTTSTEPETEAPD